MDEIVSAIRDSVAVDVDDDGLQFPIDEVAGDEIRLEAKYDGVRVKLRANLGKAVIALQIDVGFAEAIQATFERRGTRLPTEIPIALTSGYYDLPARHQQWQAYLRKGRIEGAPNSLADVAQVIARFLMPVVEATHGFHPLPERWPAGGPWQVAPRSA